MHEVRDQHIYIMSSTHKINMMQKPTELREVGSETESGKFKSQSREVKGEREKREGYTRNHATNAEERKGDQDRGMGQPYMTSTFFKDVFFWQKIYGYFYGKHIIKHFLATPSTSAQTCYVETTRGRGKRNRATRDTFERKEGRNTECEARKREGRERGGKERGRSSSGRSPPCDLANRTSPSVGRGNWRVWITY